MYTENNDKEYIELYHQGKDDGLFSRPMIDWFKSDFHKCAYMFGRIDSENNTHRSDIDVLILVKQS